MNPIDRRGLLRAVGLGAVGAAAAACAGRGRAAPAASSPGPASPPPSPSPPPGPSATATASTPAPMPLLPADLPFQVSSGPRDSSKVALTFHGQGSADIAEALLAEAASAGARVTVLAVGTWLDDQPQMARRILDAGHELGNHTLSHGNLAAMGADAAYAEIAGCAERLERLTGSKGRWLRPSQTEYCTPTVMAQARRAGYEHCLGYDVDSLDYTDPGPTAIHRNVMDRIRPGSVVSLHFGHRGTVLALPAILQDLEARGLRAVTASELFG
ncbi:polysaccharide deacetylase family protein [Kitasatospora sp. DSM 101779]|uniref:polysaccharide deacetylase family protein n=1 Tax=Kitasatospora sp. DSM 101779 TaxID=2853165 RepID=UPI0021D89460|nr:polysaccharide deacetylase family protein [Kitasatospora sp. DSM 101779]